MSTKLTAEQALELVREHYQLTDVDYCMLVRRGFNDTFLVETAQDKFIFRLYAREKYYIASNDAYRFELDLIQHLFAQGVPVAAAIPSVKGKLFGEAEAAHGQVGFALFHYADGIGLSRDSVTTKQSFAMGVAMANMHLAANEFESQFDRYRLDLTYLVNEPKRLISEGLKLDEPGHEIKHGEYILEKLAPIEQYINRVNSIGTDGDKFGIIHADMHLGNIHFRGNELTIFDFDHCAYGWRVYDLAICQGLAQEQRAAMIEGYESKRPLSQEERDSIQDLGNLRNLWDIGDILATQHLIE